MKPLQTTTLTAQDISTPLAVATYTATDDRELTVHVYLSGLAGNGTYRACLTKQRAGAGIHFQGATAAIPVANGATTAWLEALSVAVTAGDVVKAWVQGLVDDESVGVVTDVFDAASVNVTYQNGVAVAAADANGNVKAVLYGTQPAVTFGQVKILANVSSQGALHVVNSNADGQGVMYIGGEYGQVNSGVSSNVVGVDAAGIRTAIGLATANLDTQLAALPTDQDVRDAMKLAPTAGDPAAGSVDKHLDDILEDTGTTLPALISAGGSGVGLYNETITIKDPSDNPIDGVLVQVATDDLFANIVRSGYTNSLGQVTLNFDAIGTYYGRAEIGGYGVSEFEVEVTE